MWLVKPAVVIILGLVAYALFKPGKTREIADNARRSVRAFKEELNDSASEEDDVHET